MRITVTGASCFIGRALVPRLIAAGHEVTAVVRKGSSAPEGCRAAELDMSGYKDLRQAAGDADCLISLAWLGTRGSDRMDREMQQKSCEYTLDGIRSYIGSSCSVIVTAGSQAEYGSISGVISETTPPCPNTEYGKAKLSLFREAQELCGNNGIRLIEPRFFSLYGPGDYEGTMIMSMMKNMLRDRPCELTQSVQMWDFLYIGDACDALIRLIDSGASGAFNFASGDRRQLKDYVLEMHRLLNSRSELRFGAVPYPPTGMVSITADITKLTEATGWKAETSFAEGLEKIRKSG
ncbi:MAG: NAD(P)-dependent oxidoreductase [Ruminococcus sp.]|nr:NAD(P)-dependent oxidoreductase [Ruminococcus sp.]